MCLLGHHAALEDTNWQIYQLVSLERVNLCGNLPAPKWVSLANDTVAELDQAKIGWSLLYQQWQPLLGNMGIYGFGLQWWAN